MNRILGNLFLVLLLLVPVISYSAVDIIVRADRNPVHLDESFQLTFEANGSVDDDPDFSPLRVLLDVLRQSESSNISLINGSMSRSKTWTLTVMAKAVGDIQIPAIRFGDDRSQPLLISVKKADQTQMGDASFFVNLSSDVESSVEQAQIVATIRVFSDKSLNEISLSSLQFNHGDVVVETLGDETSYQTKVQGKPYLVIEQKVAIFPQKAGPLVIQPVLVLAQVRSNTRTFFGDPASKPVRARSASLSINIEPKPASASLWLPAQKLTLKDEWLSDPSQFTVGEPITRVLTLSAQGLTAAQLPELEIKAIDSVKLYPDQQELKNHISDAGVTGVRQEKIAYIPQKTGVITLPAKTIKWWNVATRQWQEVEIAEQTITVKPSSSFVEQAPIVTQPIKNEAVKIVEPINQEEQVQGENLESEQWWKWLALAFAVAWIVTLWLLFNKRKQQVIVAEKTPLKVATFKMSELKNACEKGDAQAVKGTILGWAKWRYAHASVTQLADIKALVGQDLVAHIDALEAYLYAPEKNTQWNAEGLLQAVMAENKIKNNTINETEKSLKPFHLREN